MKTISFFSRILDLIAPRQCAICGNRLSPSEDTLCVPCNMQLPRTDFLHQPADNEMARLFWGHFPIEQAAALIRFEPHSQVAHLVYGIKYHNHPEYGEYFGVMLAQELIASPYHDDQSDSDRMFFDGIDAIIPVPLTRSRLRQRGYNQSEVIARGVSSQTGIPVLTDVVKRVSFQGSQTKKDWWERKANVEKAFQLVDGEKIRGHHIILLDDIVTTGATITSCAHELQKAGDVRFSILSLGFTKT